MERIKAVSYLSLSTLNLHLNFHCLPSSVFSFSYPTKKGKIATNISLSCFVVLAQPIYSMYNVQRRKTTLRNIYKIYTVHCTYRNKFSTFEFCIHSTFLFGRKGGKRKSHRFDHYSQRSKLNVMQYLYIYYVSCTL